ncbi:putative holin [Variovorax boronicumulans]|uniref:putative holin n=1 Tax=Variovorax boronicumulans TaxID=436515 RepID=UPI0035A979C5
MKLKATVPVWLRAPRNSLWLIVAIVLLAVIASIAPVQLPVVIYKVALIALAAVLGYWIDRAAFPYARPDGYLCRDWRRGTNEPENDVDHPVVPSHQPVFVAAMLRRAIVIGATVIGTALGL